VKDVRAGWKVSACKRALSFNRRHQSFLNIIRRHRVQAGMIGSGLALGAILTMLIWPAPAVPRAPGLSLRITPSGVSDDSGTELWMVHLCMSNSSKGSFNPGKDALYIKETGRPLETRIKGRWVKLKEPLGTHSIGPGACSERLLLLPALAESCRVSLLYAGSVPTFTGRPFRGRVGWLAEQLPLSLRRRVPRFFWNGYTLFKPSSTWHEMSAEIPLKHRADPS
jgi:hypothetical protein